MKTAQKKYKAKIKRLSVDFYLKDEELYKFAKTLNFADFVKACLRCEMIHSQIDGAVCISEYDPTEDAE